MHKVIHQQNLFAVPQNKMKIFITKDATSNKSHNKAFRGEWTGTMLTCPLFFWTVFHNSAFMKILEATSLPLKGILENQQEWKNPYISEI